MARCEFKRPFPGKTADACYKAILSVVDSAGYKIFKKRDVAWLVICDGKVQGNPVNLTLSVPFGSPTAVTLSLIGDNMDEAVLQAEAERIVNLLAKNL